MPRVKSVLLVDFDNIYGATSDGMRDDVLVSKLSNWLLWLEDGALSPRGRRRFLVKRVYWNRPFNHFRADFEAAGFEAFVCEALAKRKVSAGKSSADIVMTMDAIEIAQTIRGVDEIILLTTDSDFVPVVNRLQRLGLRIVTAGKEIDQTYTLYSQHADAVIHMGALREAFGYVRTPRRWYQLRSPAPVVTPPETPRGTSASPLMQRLRQALDAQDVAANGHRPELVRAGEIICQLGEKMPDQPISRSKIVRALAQIPGFTPVYEGGRKAWFGLRNYARMMREIAKVRPEIEVRSLSGRRVEVFWRQPTLARPAPPVTSRPGTPSPEGPTASPT